MARVPTAATILQLVLWSGIVGTRFEKSSHRIVFHLEHQWWWLPAASAYHLTSSARGTLLDTLTQSEFSGSCTSATKWASCSHGALNRVSLSITWLFSNQQITWSQVTFYHTSSTHCSLKSFYFLICIKIKLIFNGFPCQELDFWRFSAEASLIHNVSVWNPKRSSRDQEWIRESEQLVIVISCYYRCRQDKASQGGKFASLYLFSNEENLPIFVDVKDSFSWW